jgi:mono/diheme cytochrome c family protein
VKPILKFAGIALLLVLVAAAGGAAYIHWKGVPRYPVQKVDLAIEVTPERVERGRKISGMLCSSCHLDPVTGRLTGHRMEDMPPQFGVAYSLNITQHPEKGIGAWTDGEIAFLLRTGIARDGRYTPPWMVKLPRASDEEIASIIAFLRSSDPLVQASDAEDFPSHPTFFTKFLTYVAFKPFVYPAQPIGAPDASADRVARGRHLADNVASCFACHSADFASNDELTPEKSKGFYAGGNAMPDLNGQVVHTSNITLDPETGIGTWTEDQFVRALRSGFRPDNTPIVYPMQAYVELTDEEARAIWAYLQTVPRIRNAVPRAPRPPVAAEASSGKKIYYKYSCQSCHGESGVGLCDLRQSLQKFETDEALIAFIRNPALTVPGSKMPAWQGVIEEAEYAPLAAHVRTLAAASAPPGVARAGEAAR